jgi:CRP/FNR family cyclic AMP-dependent transcriptional regulator
MRNDTNFLAMFGKETETRHVDAGSLLFAKGDEAHEMFIVKSGELQIFDGNFVFETIGPGDVVGEMALVDQSPRSASVKALMPCEVIPINEKRFLWMVEQTPFFAVRMLKVLTMRLRKTNEIAKSMG